MLIKHLAGLFINPSREWEAIRDNHTSLAGIYTQFVLLLALLPPIAAYIGTTQVGWQVGWGAPVKLTSGSALAIVVPFYFAILVAVYVVGKAIHWMATTYGADPTLEQCVKLAAFTATPLLLLGVTALYPLLWLNFLIGLVALAYTVYLLFTGVPIMMNISQERGFLFSSSVVTFGLVSFVALLAVTVLLWGIGIGPEFTH